MDLLVAADQCQQGNGGVGESSWQGHDGSPRESVAEELVCSYAIPNLTQMHAGCYDFMGSQPSAYHVPLNSTASRASIRGGVNRAEQGFGDCS